MTGSYDRAAAAAYARRWALERNPEYFDFTGMGGDCTNFCSQCLRAGGCAMNFTPDLGWYYRSPADRAAAWTSVEALHRFLTGHTGPGPAAREVIPEQTLPGDLIQLGDGQGWYHSLVVLRNRPGEDWRRILIAAHTDDSLCRPLGSYFFRRVRGLHITAADQKG